MPEPATTPAAHPCHDCGSGAGRWRLLTIAGVPWLRVVLCDACAEAVRVGMPDTIELSDTGPPPLAIRTLS